MPKRNLCVDLIVYINFTKIYILTVNLDTQTFFKIVFGCFIGEKKQITANFMEEKNLDTIQI